MPSQLIINADDFGLTPGVNRSIIELHRAGVLTSATLMATGAAFDDAVTLARANPSLGIGCHVVFTDGLPASLPETIPTLLGADRKSLRPSLTAFLRALLLGHIRADEIAREAIAQISRLQQAGIPVTHVDTHKHTHLFPAIAGPLLKVLAERGIPAIRNPFEPVFSQQLGHAALKRRLQVRVLSRLRTSFDRQPQIASGAVATTDGTIGVSATGNLNASTLAQLLSTLPSEGTYELVCHPGYNDSDLDRIKTRLRRHRETEMHALHGGIPLALSRPDAPRLVHFGALAPSVLEARQ